MSAAEALQKAQASGVAIDVDGDDLVLVAKREPPPDVLSALRQEKGAIIDLLRSLEGRDWRAFFNERAAIVQYDGRKSRVAAEAAAYEDTVAWWLARNPINTDAGRCAWCGAVETHEDVLIPYGVGSHHAWLHFRCYPAWSDDRQSQAEAALAALGISRPSNVEDGS